MDNPKDSDLIDNVMPMRYVRNIPYPCVPWFQKENIEASLDYKACDGDIILTAYAKTGNTWLQSIVWQILHKGEHVPDYNDMSKRLVPFMEMCGVEAIENLAQPRFYKNHFRYNMMTINDNAKYLYIHRDPKDTVVSCYHFHHALGLPTVDFDIYFEAFLKGKVSYGDYFDHILSFYPHRNDQNVLFLSYEELHKDTKNQVLRVAKFLGEDYYQMLKVDGDLLAKILEVTSFDYMKKNMFMKLPVKKGWSQDSELDSSKSGGKGNTIEFFRKGVVGDGKNLLSEEQIKKLRKRTVEKMNGTELAELWA